MVFFCVSTSLVFFPQRKESNRNGIRVSDDRVFWGVDYYAFKMDYGTIQTFLCHLHMGYIHDFFKSSETRLICVDLCVEGENRVISVKVHQGH